MEIKEKPNFPHRVFQEVTRKTLDWIPDCMLTCTPSVITAHSKQSAAVR